MSMKKQKKCIGNNISRLAMEYIGLSTGLKTVQRECEPTITSTTAPQWHVVSGLETWSSRKTSR
jgi:hypothetical protein